jgi:hypothetical protein
MVYEGRLYLYTSHDEDVTGDSYTMNDWHLYSTVDMVNWTDHGTPAGYKTFKWGTDNAWAPQGIARNGKFYLFVPINNNTGAKIGVAVATDPAGPFTDPIGKELVSNGSMAIDPTVFIDDDGQAHLYWGNGNLRYVKLNSDMISTSGSVATNVALNGFVEGPWFYKRGSIYYMVYAAGSGNEKISYATASAAAGPWTYKGDVMAAGTIFTNHPGVVDYKGHSYFFYHNGALPGGNMYRRSVCVDEFTYGTDGSIPKITGSTAGPAAIATLNPFDRVEAETIANSSGLKTEVCTDTGGGMNVTSISNGDYIKVKDVDFLDGVTGFEARVSSSASNSKIELVIDSQTGKSLGTCDVSGATAWTTKNCTVSGGSGKHDLFLKFVGGGGDLFKFNWWKFTGPTTPPTGAGGASGGGAAGAGGDASRGGNVAQSGGRTGTAPVAAGGGSGGRIATTGGAATTSSSNTGGRSSTSSSAESTGGRVVANGGTTNVGGSSSPITASGGTTSATASAPRGGQPASSTVVATGGASTATSASATTAAQGAGTSTSGVANAEAPASSGCDCRVEQARGSKGALGALWLIGSALLVRRRTRRVRPR